MASCVPLLQTKGVSWFWQVLLVVALGACTNPKPNQPATTDAIADTTTDTASDTQPATDAAPTETETDSLTDVAVDTGEPEEPTATVELSQYQTTYHHTVRLEVGPLGDGIWKLQGWYLSKHPDIAGPWEMKLFSPNNKLPKILTELGIPGDYEVCAELLEVATGDKSVKCVQFSIAVLPGHHFLFVHSGIPAGKSASEAWECESYAWVNLPALVTLADQSQATCAQATDLEYLAGDGLTEEFEHGGELTPIGSAAFPLGTAMAISHEPTATAALDVMISYLNSWSGEPCSDTQLQILEFKDELLVWQSPAFALTAQSGQGPVKVGALVLPAGGSTATASWIPCTEAVDLCPDVMGVCATLAP